MNHSYIVLAAHSEIFRLEALLKAMLIAAFEMVERKNQNDIVQPEDFPYLFDVAIDRLSLIKDHTDELETAISNLEADHEKHD